MLQRDSHTAEMTVAETLAYASESLGPGLAEGACACLALQGCRRMHGSCLVAYSPGTALTSIVLLDG